MEIQWLGIQVRCPITIAYVVYKFCVFCLLFHFRQSWPFFLLAQTIAAAMGCSTFQLILVEGDLLFLSDPTPVTTVITETSNAKHKTELYLQVHYGNSTHALPSSQPYTTLLMLWTLLQFCNRHPSLISLKLQLWIVCEI